MEGLIGKMVEFTTGNATVGVEKLTGTVIDKIDMKIRSTDPSSITGYIIQGEDGKICNNVAHWRIQKILNK